MNTTSKKILITALAAFLLSGLFISSLEAATTEALVKRYIKKLDWSNASEAKTAYNELLMRGEKAAPYLLAALNDHFENTSIRVNCADLLGKIKSKDAIPTLEQTLRDTQMRLRYASAIALGRIGDNSALPALINATDDPDITVKAHVLTAIKNIGDKKAGPDIIKMLEDENYSIRQLTAEILLFFKTKEAGPAFIKILNEGWDILEVRVLAARILGEVGGSGAVEALSKSLLRDRDERVREECALALGRIKDKRAIPDLIKALDDEYRGISLNSMTALSQITGKDLGVDPEKWREWYTQEYSSLP